MPRGKRIRSATGVYHIMVRGINKEDIFIDERDRTQYLKLLYDVFKETQTDIMAYCLMSNHVHLLLKENEEDELSLFMKKLSIRYALWFNDRYDRIGHLFQGRFKSEVVENEAYYRTVMRYILQNPVKAKIASAAHCYKWSSYAETIKAYNSEDSIVQMDITERCWPDSDGFKQWVELLSQDLCLEHYTSKKEENTAMMNWILKRYEDLNGHHCILSRDNAIKRIKKETGASVKIISDSTGQSLWTVRHALEDKN